ncbi:MAG TPA: hypothetical protein VFE53_17630 [Mucilaginibacter sp.]|jgi:hypothetical protein|nr:hypothetical protein [Mucilaginibacter sp.]
MRKHIIITLILLALTAYVTVVYFKNLNAPESHAGSVISVIPDTAPLIFEFNNESSFYDIFKSDTLFSTVTGKKTIGELDTLRQQVLLNPILNKYFAGQNVFISFHPSSEKKIELLITLSASKDFTADVINNMAKQPNTGLQIKPLHTAVKTGYTFYVNALRKPFYLVEKEENVWSGSFSDELIRQAAAYKPQKTKRTFILLPDQQNANSLANLYVNYSQLDPLFSLIFKNRNTDIFREFRMFPGFAALSLNYKTGALMFEGTSATGSGKGGAGYLDLFAAQQPVINHLKDIFPSTSAYVTSFAVSDPGRFCRDLAKWHNETGLKSEQQALFSKIQAETGIDLPIRFSNLLGNEFALVTTRYFEKLGIISIKDGSKMNLLLMNIGKIRDVNSGQLSYDKLPFYLLGDAFGVFKHPYFKIIDNYLILANSPGELKSYDDSYLNRKFLSKNDQYRQFDNLVSAQSNVAFFLILKDAGPIFNRDMSDAFLEALQSNEPGWKNFYAVSWQFSAVDKNFYSNFCLKLKADTAIVKN